MLSRCLISGCNDEMLSDYATSRLGPPAAAHLMMNRSTVTVSSTNGRCTLTATSSPVFSLPLYTCKAIEDQPSRQHGE